MRKVSWNSSSKKMDESGASRGSRDGLGDWQFSSSSSSARAGKARSESEGEPWGWFADVEAARAAFPPSSSARAAASSTSFSASLSTSLTATSALPLPLSAPPPVVLESALSTQRLWYLTAGRRPVQPRAQRLAALAQWRENCARSQVPGARAWAAELDEAELAEGEREGERERRARRDRLPPGEFECQILINSKHTFTNAVSKSFDTDDGFITSLTLQIPRFRVVREKDGTIHAEFLSVISVGGGHASLTFGIWKRHSDFCKLAMAVQERVASGKEDFKNSWLSWQCLLQRKKWFRCLEKDYLSLKSFLLERFMHDLLFESPTPNLITDFLGLD